MLIYKHRIEKIIFLLLKSKSTKKSIREIFGILFEKYSKYLGNIIIIKYLRLEFIFWILFFNYPEHVPIWNTFKKFTQVFYFVTAQFIFFPFMFHRVIPNTLLIGTTSPDFQFCLSEGLERGIVFLCSHFVTTLFYIFPIFFH